MGTSPELGRTSRDHSGVFEAFLCRTDKDKSAFQDSGDLIGVSAAGSRWRHKKGSPAQLRVAVPWFGLSAEEVEHQVPTPLRGNGYQRDFPFGVFFQ